MQKLKITFLLSLLLLGLIANKANAQSIITRVEGKGQPMVLIPGLTCAGEVWDESITQMKGDFEYHIITLPGFAGNGPMADHEDRYLEKVRDMIIDYIHEQKLEKPVIMGHSLGGFLALSITIKEPELPSKLIIVDSLPFLPGVQMPGATPESAKAMATSMKAQMLAAKDQPVESRKNYQRMMLKTMIIDSAKIEKAAQWGADSDMETVAQSMYELYTIDLRDDLKKIKVPTLVMGAYIAYKPYGATRESVMKSYTDQYAQLEGAVVDLTDKGNHFIMWDDPEFFQAWLGKFL